MTKVKKSYCHLCSANCGINVTLDNNKVIKISPDFDDPISQGYVCEKSQSLINFQYHKDRITRPLKQTAKGFEEISWEQAFKEITKKLKSINKDKIFYMSSAVPKFEQYLYSEQMARLGAKYITNVFSVEKMYEPYCRTQLFEGHAPIADIESSKTLFIIGQNTWVTQHLPQARKILNQIKNNPHRNLIVVDPYKTKTAELADYHIELAPGTNSWFLLSLIKVLIDNNLVDKEFIQKNTTNFDKLKSFIDNIDLNEYLNVCKVPHDQLFTVAKIISKGGLSVMTGNGVCHSLYSLSGHYLTMLLYILTGNINKKGAMDVILNGIGLGRVSDHYFTQTKMLNNKNQFGGISPAGEVVNNLENFECVIVEQSNPVCRFPNKEKFISQLNKMKLIIALDSFKTETTQLADYILPTTTPFEEYNIIAPKISSTLIKEPILETNAKEVGEILSNLLDKTESELEKLYNQNFTDFIDSLYKKYINKEPIVYQVLIQTLGKEYKTEKLAILWWQYFLINKQQYDTVESINRTNQTIDTLEKNNYSGERQLEKSYSTIDLMPAHLKSSLKLSYDKLKNNKFSFILQCGYRQSDCLNNVIPNTREPMIELSKQDAELLSLKVNERVILETESSTVKLGYKIDNKLPIGLIRLQDHAIINKLTNTKNLDYFNPQYKLVFANIRKINGISDTTD